uniref:Uncharacterized protein n=1 Tax=Tanacetum cinerariifolium TaxID=118510 RepID=A0A6L2K077_TANCI|nr:hypothetical protein [Tanacetum cinerariifolium]
MKLFQGMQLIQKLRHDQKRNIVTNLRVTPSWREIVSLTVLVKLASYTSPSNLDRFTLPSHSLRYSHAPPETSNNNNPFKSILGASVCANAHTPTIQLNNNTLNNNLDINYDYSTSGYESTSSFSSFPLQPLPRGDSVKGGFFLSGSIERGLSGPLDSNSLKLGLGNSNGVAYSAPLNTLDHRRRLLRHRFLARFLRADMGLIVRGASMEMICKG